MDINRYVANSGNRGNCGGLNPWQFVTASASILACLAATVLVVPDAPAREICVAKIGNDSHAGNPDNPYLTIGKAATAAQPGDTVTVHAGTYREWVKPVRGGRDENSRVTYRAAAGEEVLIKGSERITSWAQHENGVWMVELPNRFFGDYNPYALNISGGWLLYGQWLHRGDVYLDGEAFQERKTLEDVKRQRQTWYCRASEKNTTIWANFGKGNPNAQLAEINVRESVFMPARSGLNYITVSGFHVLHSAENWQPPVIPLQMGTIGPRMGKHWIIENCTVTNARCVGISLGQAPGLDYTDIDAFGGHIVRNNVIRRCGEAGIAGQKGATRCLIAANLIEDTNYRKEFGGWETAAIKFHESVDTVICGNLIRRVSYQNYGAFGIWMDWANQGIRITGNVIYDTQAANIFLEMDHGPTLVDNNVLVGQGVKELTPRAASLRTISSWTASSRWSPTPSRLAILPAAYPKRGCPQARRPGRRQVVQQHLCSSGARGRQEGRRVRIGLQCLPGRGEEVLLRR